MPSSELRDYATVLAALVALMVFMLNVVSQMRNRRIENITRFNQVHQRLFEDNGYLARNLTAMATETLHRDLGNADMERKFHLMLRMYWPDESPPSIIDGSWKIPPVAKA